MKKILTLFLMSIFFITLSGFAKIDYVVVGSEDDVVYLANYDKDKIWEYTEATSKIQDVYVFNDFIYALEFNNQLHKIDLDGNKIWEIEVVIDVLYDIDVDQLGNVYVASDSNELYKFDSDGNEIWVYDSFTEDARLVSINDTHVFVGTANGEVHKIDFDGNQVYTITGFSLITQLFVTNENIYIEDANNNFIYKYDDATQTEQWSYSQGNTLNSLYFYNDEVYYSNGQGIDVLDDSDGSLNRSLSNTNIEKSIEFNNFIYVAFDDSNVSKLSTNFNEIWTLDYDGGLANGLFVFRDYRYDSTTTSLLYLLPTIYTITIISGGFVFAIVRKNENRMKSILETAIFIVLGLSLLPIIIAMGQW